jgi:hypothetical protein
MNGWQFIQQQKSDPKLSKIPSLIFSRSVDRARPGLTTRHQLKSESLEELMESVSKICDEDLGINEHAPEIRRIVLPSKQKRIS